MDASQDRGLTRDIAINQRDVVVSGCQFFKSHHQEIAPWGWQFGFCHSFKLHVFLQIMLVSSPIGFCMFLFCHKAADFT
ncbi:hypothetical protein CKO_01359 [Citrobacter koseri ATCC BAA-895]|uniref:Uncharacterized protein n=1 Tax=Citrobacter koseri (strain ATCC BAA-895 / CDC 4225-83 / SGSC4696) TaxID=290338 RepID=A8AG84_CITK8|nr:hypothetical protein CKO_01359 [Citrobacter koseri ATCC BAA-895]